MSFREIGQLTPVPTLDTTALFEIEQGGNSFKTDLADMLALQTSNLSGLTIDANKDWLGFDITNLGNLGVTGFIDLLEIAAPANPAVNTGRLYVQDVASTTTLFFRDSFGTATNLLLPGEVLTWTANHDANGFALVDPFFADPADNSKQMKISLGNQATGTILTLVSNQTTTQTLNIPDITVNDEIVTELFTQQLSNKTLIVPIISDFSNATHSHVDAAEAGQLDSTLALSDTANIAYLNTPNAYVAGNRQDFLGDTGGTAGLNVGGIAGNPLTKVDGDIWLNTSTNQLFARVNGVDLDIGSTGIAPPFDDNISIVKGSVDPTKELRIEVDGNATGVIGVIATTFSTAKIITIPDVTDTLVGKATTDIFTNKTYNVDGAGNFLTATVPTVGTYLRDDGVQFLASAILSSDLPPVTAITDQPNTFGDFAQSFADDQFFIRNPADSFAYQFVASAIVADRSVTLPLLLANDVFVMEAFTQTLTNKSLGTGTSWTAIPTISDGLRITFNPDNTNAGLNAGQNANEPSVAINGDIFYDSTAGFLKGRNNGVWQQLGGEIFTWSADHDAAGFDLLNVGGITINNPADTFQYIITPDAIVADRIINLPLLTGPDTFVTEAFSQTLTNKIINSLSNTITIVKADISDFPIVTADITDDNVTFAKIENIDTARILGRVTGGTGVIEELTSTQATTLINTFTDVLKGLVPASGGGTTNFLRADGTFASPSGAGEQNTISSDGGGLGLTATISKVGVDLRVRSLAATSPLNVAEAADLITFTIDLLVDADIAASAQIANAKLADIATATILGRTTAGSGVREELTGTQATTLLDTFTDALKGLVPASGGGTLNFLRADGTFAVPPGTGEVNTISSDGGGLALTATIPKVGVDLRVRSLAATLPISVAEATNLITISSAQFGAANSGHVPSSGGGTVNFLRADGTWDVPPGTGATINGHVIQDEGTPLTQRANLNFVGAAVTVTDGGVGPDSTIVTITGGGDMILAAVQTVTGAKTFADNAFLIENPAMTFAYLFQGGAIIADRTIILPVLIANDTLVFEAHIQTLTNKAINALNNTITNIGSPEVIADIITGQTAIVDVALDDELLIHDKSALALRRVEVQDLIAAIWINAFEDDGPGNNDFFGVGGGRGSDPNELDRQAPVAEAAFTRKMGVTINANATASATDWNLRINGANGNQTISIPAATTGFFRDLVNTDTLAAGDLIAYQVVNLGAGGFNVTGATMVETTFS